MGWSSLWSISWLRHQIFYPNIMISAAQARESDDLRHVMSPFLFLFLLSWIHKESWDMWGHEGSERCVLQKQGEEGASGEPQTAFVWRCDVMGLEMLRWRMQNWTETQQMSAGGGGGVDGRTNRLFTQQMSSQRLKHQLSNQCLVHCDGDEQHSQSTEIWI